MGDAFAEKNRKKAWTLFLRATGDEHVAPEIVHGILFSQVKNMLLAKKEDKNPGVHPFVFQKAKRYALNFKTEELEKLSASLVELYHDGRRGICDMHIALERFILNI